MGLIDSHAHLTSKEFEGIVADVLDRAVAAGVERVISIGTDMTDAQRVIELARSDARVHAAVGIHPHEAGKVRDGDWDLYEELMHDPHVVALGEMGLDYHYDFADRKTQADVFERQLDLASSAGKPIVIHCREAHDDAVSMLRNLGLGGRRVVFHCFTGTEREATEIADNDWRLSFTGVVTFKSADQVRRIAVAYPIDQLMIETDSPYLSPIPVRRVRPNEPAHVAHIARFLAAERGITYDELASRTCANTVEFFTLPSHRDGVVGAGSL